MLKNQRTIKSPVSFSGVGLHTGTQTTITFKPADVNTGYRFIRIDLEGYPEIPALVEHVVDISRGTTLGKGGAIIHTVEHVLAALSGLQIDNSIIEINGKEPPVGDGSAKPFVDILIKAGFEEQNAPRDYLVIDEEIEYKDEKNKVDIVALPTDDFRITVMIDFNNQALGSQHSGLFSLEREFRTEFAPSRTFCFLHEVEALAEAGLIKGGNLDNAIVIVDRELDDKELQRLKKKLNLKKNVILGNSGVLNNKPLIFPNEPCRHKLLDLLGDLALVGAPLKGQILAARPGHRSNIEFAKLIRKVYDKKQIVKKYQTTTKKGVVFDIQAIQRILPHRYPFLLIDKIIEFEPGVRIVGIKNVTMNEPFFQGHFEGLPVMPGVLILEAMAQAGGIMLLNQASNPDDKIVYITGLDNVRFRRPVIPGDQLRFEMEFIRMKRSTCKWAGKVFVENKLVAEAQLMASIVDR